MDEMDEIDEYGDDDTSEGGMGLIDIGGIIGGIASPITAWMQGKQADKDRKTLEANNKLAIQLQQQQLTVDENKRAFWGSAAILGGVALIAFVLISRSKK